MKPCSKCLQTLPLAAFPRNRVKPDGHGSQCRGCKRVYHAQWYERNRGRHRRNVAAISRSNRAAARLFVAGHLAEHPCVDCGESDPVVLEFDHVRGEKVAAVATLVGGNPSLRAVQAEVAKCEVRCANCHRRRHARERATNASQMQATGTGGS